MHSQRTLQKQGFGYELKRNKVLFIMILPAVIYFLIFMYLPMGGIILAFKNYHYADGIFGSPWVGLKNFEFMLINGKIFRVAWNTIAYNATFIVVNHMLQILAAVFLAEITSKIFKKISQSFMFFPYFISWVIVGGMIKGIFNYEYGMLNTLLKSLSLDPVDVVMNVGVWKYILVASSAWKWVGYGTIIYLSAIMGIDSELYSAAEVDGAGKIRKVVHITLPLIVPQIVVLVLLNIGYIFRGDFSMFYQVTGNNPLLYETTDVIDTYVVRSLLSVQDIGMATAAGLTQSVIGFAILYTCNTIVKRVQKDYALF